MAMIRCTACDKEISEKAVTCPGCGQPGPGGEQWKIPPTPSSRAQKMKTRPKDWQHREKKPAWIGWVVTLVVLLALASALLVPGVGAWIKAKLLGIAPGS